MAYDKHTGMNLQFALNLSKKPFCITSGRLIGFTDLGDINNHLSEYKRSLGKGKGDDTMVLANSILVFMVKGLFNAFHFPYAQVSLHHHDWGSTIPVEGREQTRDNGV